MVHFRHGSIYGLGDMLIALKGKSYLHNCKDEMKDSIFLRSLSQNEKKLIVAGEYRSIFEKKYKGNLIINYL